jgi:transposase
MWGDWSKRDGWRNQGPVPNVRYRKLFQRAVFTVLLVNEHRTSITCSRCAFRPLVHFRQYPDPRPKEPPISDPWPNITAWGLLQCANCYMIWNRDANASINIRNIGLEYLQHGVRPRYLGFGNHMGF